MLMIFVLSPCFLLSLELFRSLSFACKLLPSSLVLFVGGSDAARVFAFARLSVSTSRARAPLSFRWIIRPRRRGSTPRSGRARGANEL